MLCSSSGSGISNGVSDSRVASAGRVKICYGRHTGTVPIARATFWDAWNYGLGSHGYHVQQIIQAKCCFYQIPACNVKYYRWRAAMCFHAIPSCKFKQLRVELKEEVAAWLRAEDEERDAMQSQLP